MKSIEQCKKNGSTIRIGPELEVSGYGCEDHFYEIDTINHSWEVIADILDTNLTDDILCDIGLPIIYQGINYNARVIIYNRKILLIRPKMALADDGNYRENRWFTAWNKEFVLENFDLPLVVQNVNGQKNCKIGLGIIQANDCSYAVEMCEELWVPHSPSIEYCMLGVDIISNSSGSHFQILKQERRIELIVNSAKKNGGVFIYSNIAGCDGGRLYFDGGSFICLNGKMISEGKRFTLNEIDIVSGVVDLIELRSYRNSIKSRCVQSSFIKCVPIIELDGFLCKEDPKNFNPFNFITPKIYTFEEEIALAPSCWIWDYLRRSGASGLFLPLSGGADSSCVAIMISILTKMIFKEISENKNQFVLEELRKIVKNKEYYPKSEREIANNILITCYMGSKNSSETTRLSAKNLSEEIGSYHKEVNIDKIVSAFSDTFTEEFKLIPKFNSQGGSDAEDIALQNIQARIRMTLSYFIASLIPWIRGKAGFCLMLSSGNLDECILGYLTKYDCSSGDLNPIGSISKERLKKFLVYCEKFYGYKSLSAILNLVPTAELRPQNENHQQTDEEDMGLTYKELSIMAQLRKDYRCGPVSMFKRLLTVWNELIPQQIYNKVKIFFRKYSINRHKMTVITPSLHAESYSLDDNRYDLRQFLYDANWTFQFKNIDKFMENNKNIIKLNN